MTTTKININNNKTIPLTLTLPISVKQGCIITRDGDGQCYALLREQLSSDSFSDQILITDSMTAMFGLITVMKGKR